MTDLRDMSPATSSTDAIPGPVLVLDRKYGARVEDLIGRLESRGLKVLRKALAPMPDSTATAGGDAAEGATVEEPEPLYRTHRLAERIAQVLRDSGARRPLARRLRRC